MGIIEKPVAAAIERIDIAAVDHSGVYDLPPLPSTLPDGYALYSRMRDDAGRLLAAQICECDTLASAFEQANNRFGDFMVPIHLDRQSVGALVDETTAFILNTDIPWVGGVERIRMESRPAEDGCLTAVAIMDGKDYPLALDFSTLAEFDEARPWLEAYVRDMHELLRGYIGAALWSGTDDEGTPLDSMFSGLDIDPDTITLMRVECAEFYWQNIELMQRALDIPNSGRPTVESLGHDFWLTRNRHGAGFWDRGLGEVGEKLSELAKSFGESDLYVGDDGKLHIDAITEHQLEYAQPRAVSKMKG